MLSLPTIAKQLFISKANWEKSHNPWELRACGYKTVSLLAYIHFLAILSRGEVYPFCIHWYPKTKKLKHNISQILVACHTRTRSNVTTATGCFLHLHPLSPPPRQWHCPSSNASQPSFSPLVNTSTLAAASLDAAGCFESSFTKRPSLKVVGWGWAGNLGVTLSDRFDGAQIHPIVMKLHRGGGATKWLGSMSDKNCLDDFNNIQYEHHGFAGRSITFSWYQKICLA